MIDGHGVGDVDPDPLVGGLAGLGVDRFDDEVVSLPRHALGDSGNLQSMVREAHRGDTAHLVDLQSGLGTVFQILGERGRVGPLVSGSDVDLIDGPVSREVLSGGRIGICDSGKDHAEDRKHGEHHERHRFPVRG